VVDAHSGADMHSGGGQTFAAAAREDVDVLPIRRPIALVGFGLPDPRALLGGVLGPECEDRGERLVLAEHCDGAEPEVAGIHHPWLCQVQRAVGLDRLDQHGQFVHVRHHPRRCAGSHRGFVAGAIRSEITDQLARVIGPHIVDDGFQFAGTHRAHRVLLAARSVSPQQFLQQAVVASWSSCAIEFLPSPAPCRPAQQCG
jgi:hypothetical protein